MSDEYIKKEYAIRALKNKASMLRDATAWHYEMLYGTEIMRIPPADVVERKRGEWIYHESCGSDRYDDYRCSNCGTLITVDARRCDDIGFVIEDFRYCPNCGSDNRGDDNESD